MARNRSFVARVLDSFREAGADVTHRVALSDHTLSTRLLPVLVPFSIAGMLTVTKDDLSKFSCRRNPQVFAVASATMHGGLPMAALVGDTSAIEAGLEDEAQVEAMVRDMVPLVTLAAMSGDVATLHAVLQYTALIGEDTLRDALYAAGESGAGGDIVDALVAAGARCSGERFVFRLVEDAFRVDPSTAIALMRAAWTSGLEAEANPSRYLCHYATSDAMTVRTLIDAGADVNVMNDAVSPDAYSLATMPALLCAIDRDMPLAVYELLLAGAQVDIPPHGVNARSETVGLDIFSVRAGRDEDASRLDHCSALQVVRCGFIAQMLVDAGAPIDTPFAGMTSLHRACWRPVADVVRVLLGAGADPNGRGSGTMGAMCTPLLYTLKKRHDWYIGLELAVQVAAIVKHLVAAGADVNYIAPDCSGASPLLIAAHFRAFEECPAAVPVIDALLAGGANVRAADVFGDTVLHLVMAAPSDEPRGLIRTLLAHGARADVPNSAGMLPHECWWIHRAVGPSSFDRRNYPLDDKAYRPDVPEGFNVDAPEGVVGEAYDMLRAAAGAQQS